MGVGGRAELQSLSASDFSFLASARWLSPLSPVARLWLQNLAQKTETHGGGWKGSCGERTVGEQIGWRWGSRTPGLAGFERVGLTFERYEGECKGVCTCMCHPPAQPAGFTLALRLWRRLLLPEPRRSRGQWSRRTSRYQRAWPTSHGQRRGCRERLHMGRILPTSILQVGEL